MGAADLNSEPHGSTGHLYHPRQLRLCKEEIPDRNELRARESLRFCFLPLSLWQLHVRPFLGGPRLARSPLLRRERGSEKGWSVALGGASGSWRGEEVNEMRTVPGNLPVWR